ncbi:hypothetical protein D3C80_1559090 [compost metagenome]
MKLLVSSSGPAIPVVQAGSLMCMDSEYTHTSQYENSAENFASAIVILSGGVLV